VERGQFFRIINCKHKPCIHPCIYWQTNNESRWGRISNSCWCVIVVILFCQLLHSRLMFYQQ